LESEQLMDVMQIAKVCHEANRAFCSGIGDDSHLPWEETSDDIKASAMDGVQKILNNPEMTPAESHVNWFYFKKKEGWKYGPVKDAEKKEHPCMVEYFALPVERRINVC
jgi:hypothetical protein